MKQAIFRCRDIRVEKETSSSAFHLQVNELTIRQGEKVALVGPSGCGKSTLLDLLSIILPPRRAGEFIFSGPDGLDFDVSAAFRNDDQDGISAVRRRYMGYVLQTGGLLPFLTVRRNMRISRDLNGMIDDGTIQILADTLGIGGQLDKFPQELSVGERQRGAIARALAHKPWVVMADEPTAALDPERSDQVMAGLIELADRFHTTVIIASHDWERVERFGLRRLQYRFAKSQGGRVHQSFFSDG